MPGSDEQIESAPAAAELPRWQSHKTVHAVKIVKVDGDRIIVEGPYAPIKAATNMFARYMPVPGDYYVVYDDGYASISPRKAFEEGYYKL